MSRSSTDPKTVKTPTETPVQAVLDDFVARGAPLPGHMGRPSIVEVAQLVGCHSRSVYRCQDQVDAAFAVVGATSHMTLPTVITATCDGAPWIDAIATHHTRDDGVAALARMLQVACYIVIAFLSGMRDSEIKHLRRGCLATAADRDGVAYRWRVASLAFKGEADPAGVAATWVVGQPAARAVAVLEALQPAGTDLLLTRLAHGQGARLRNATAAVYTRPRTTR